MKALVPLGILLVIAWVFGFVVFKVAGLLIHLLLIIGVILLLMSLVRRASGANRSRG